jgi:hypothetical protein
MLLPLFGASGVLAAAFVYLVTSSWWPSAAWGAAVGLLELAHIDCSDV